MCVGLHDFSSYFHINLFNIYTKSHRKWEWWWPQQRRRLQTKPTIKTQELMCRMDNSTIEFKKKEEKKKQNLLIRIDVYGNSNIPNHTALSVNYMKTKQFVYKLDKKRKRKKKNWWRSKLWNATIDSQVLCWTNTPKREHNNTTEPTEERCYFLF